jgi:NTP pyrophosphatase (non-canonical NTP hydrolase)
MYKKKIKKTDLNEISKQIYEANKLKGFDVKNENMGQTLCLIHSEVTEALEAVRNNRYCKIKGFHLDYARCVESIETGRPYTYGDSFVYAFENQIKNTFEDEIADTFIRLMDLVGAFEIDIDTHIELKLKYNTTRNFKHDKQF